MIVAAHNECDAHRDVVGHDGHVVDRRSVRAQDDEILDVFVGERDHTVDNVVPRRLAIRNTKAYDEWHARGDTPRDFVRWQSITASIVLERVAARLCLTTTSLDLIGRAKASIRGAALQQSLRVGTMLREVRSLMDDRLVPGKAEPLESLEDGARARLGAARAIRVLDA